MIHQIYHQIGDKFVTKFVPKYLGDLHLAKLKLMTQASLVLIYQATMILLDQVLSGDFIIIKLTVTLRVLDSWQLQMVTQHQLTE